MTMEKLGCTVILLLIFCFASQTNSEECADLRKFVVEELRELNAKEEKLSSKITALEIENLEKEEKIKNLEEEVIKLKVEGGCCQRERRQARSNIAFTAYHTRHMYNLTKDQNIIYDNVLLNDGNAYSSTTGVFTAPVSGVYLFSYSVGTKQTVQVQLSQYDAFTRLVVNGVHQLSAVAESTTLNDDEQSSTTAILFVLEGDRVWTILENRGGSYLYANNLERISSFTGTLLYERTVGGIVG